jgi:hypothetical protein
MTKDEPVDDALTRLNAELSGESDRAVVLIGTSMIEEALTGVLQAHLVPNPSASDTLFDGPNAPLASFSNKIDCAFRMGVVSSRFARDLHLIRRIRNEFAHRAASCDLKDPQARNRIEELTKSHGIFERSPKKVKEDGKPSLKEQFVEAVSWMLYSLDLQRTRVSQLKSREHEFGYEFSYDEDYPAEPE